MKRRTWSMAALIVLFLGLSSCGRATPTPTPLNEKDRVSTAAAQTVAALGTRIASGENPTLGAATYTVTPAPTQTQRAAPSDTPRPDVSPTATIDAPCNQASFVDDVTIPDDSMLTPNSVFTKTWEIKNTGSCTWDSSYAVVFAGRGTSMSGPAASNLESGAQVRPGETARISVSLRAPNDPGGYEGYWMLRSGDGKSFGTGQGGGAPFFVKITVGESYNFAEHWCSARWSSGAGDLPCPGAQEAARGTVAQQKDPRLENNETREGLALLVAPEPIPGGYIVGRFPPVMVPDQADFRATISCQPGAEGCYVRFRVAYQVGGGEEQTLGEWNEGYEGGITEAIRDLNTLAGQSVAFSLYVYVNGTPNQAKGIWFNPRITK